MALSNQTEIPFVCVYMSSFTHSGPAICNPKDCSPPGSCVCGILQATILEWVVIPFSTGFFQTQGWNMCLPHWQADSLLLSQQGSPESPLRLLQIANIISDYITAQNKTLAGTASLSEIV